MFLLEEFAPTYSRVCPRREVTGRGEGGWVWDDLLMFIRYCYRVDKSCKYVPFCEG